MKILLILTLIFSFQITNAAGTLFKFNDVVTSDSNQNPWEITISSVVEPYDFFRICYFNKPGDKYGAPESTGMGKLVCLVHTGIATLMTTSFAVKAELGLVSAALLTTAGVSDLAKAELKSGLNTSISHYYETRVMNSMLAVSYLMALEQEPTLSEEQAIENLEYSINQL